MESQDNKNKQSDAGQTQVEGSTVQKNQSSHAAQTKPRRWRRTVVGGTLAALLMAGLGGLAWYLTHQPASGPGAGGPGGPGGGGGRGFGGRGGGPASTVGVAKAERQDIPVVVEALGTVTSASTATV